MWRPSLIFKNVLLHLPDFFKKCIFFFRISPLCKCLLVCLALDSKYFYVKKLITDISRHEIEHKLQVQMNLYSIKKYSTRNLVINFFYRLWSSRIDYFENKRKILSNYQNNLCFHFVWNSKLKTIYILLMSHPLFQHQL